MPTFDVVSELDMQEVRNAVDQASREISTRFDFKNTGSSIELKEKEIELDDRERGSPHRAHAGARGEAGEAPGVAEGARLRQDRRGARRARCARPSTLNVGISTDKAKEIGKFVKELGLKGVSHQIQGDQLRISGKKRDDLQSAIAAMKDHDFDVPLQFTNFRD